MTEAFRVYEAALVGNDVAVLDELFWDSPLTLRYGTGESLRGIEAMRAFRHTRNPHRTRSQPAQHRDQHLRPRPRHRQCRNLQHAGQPAGRQSQTWVRMAQGWRVVAAHVSFAKEP